ncbi:MAG: hypothetical protein M3P18_15690 [Actinomycetota bacterium]|nr:hypothetical protein [Actinomycetota bacterium]
MDIATMLPDHRGCQQHGRSRTAHALICGPSLLVVWSTPAYAAPGDVTTVIDSIRNRAAGILAALATLFLTVGGFATSSQTETRARDSGVCPLALDEGRPRPLARQRQERRVGLTARV